MIVSIVVAVAKNGVIGKDNQLIWRLRDDLKLFKKITTGHHILMGRKTFEAIGQPLPNRTNIIISRNDDFAPIGCITSRSLADGIKFAEKHGEEELFIIGGGEIYKQVLQFTDKIYYTKVNASPEGDAFFPTLNMKEWEIISTKSFPEDERNEYSFEFMELKRVEDSL